MADKMSVTIPLTAQQKDRIRKATGKTIQSLKVESGGGVSLKKIAAGRARLPLGRVAALRPTVSARRIESTKRTFNG